MIRCFSYFRAIYTSLFKGDSWSSYLLNWCDVAPQEATASTVTMVTTMSCIVTMVTNMSCSPTACTVTLVTNLYADQSILIVTMVICDMLCY